MSLPSETTTVQYYDDHADEFVRGTVDVDMESLYRPFLELVPHNGTILDAGCGSGRDTKAFLDRGYRVTAIDASANMVSATTQLTDRPAKQMRFQELNYRDEFDAIWACASVLHVPLVEFDQVLNRFVTAMRSGGVCYLSMKEGVGERTERGRLFTDFTKSGLRARLEQQSSIVITRIWATNDLRPGRIGEQWLNALVNKV